MIKTPVLRINMTDVKIRIDALTDEQKRELITSLQSLLLSEVSPKPLPPSPVPQGV